MKYIIILLFSSIALVGCISDEQLEIERAKIDRKIELEERVPKHSKAEKVLINNGFTIKQKLWKPFFKCSKDDSIITSGKYRVVKNWIEQDIIVCCGLLLKWCTIRF